MSWENAFLGKVKALGGCFDHRGGGEYWSPLFKVGVKVVGWILGWQHLQCVLSPQLSPGMGFVCNTELCYSHGLSPLRSCSITCVGFSWEHGLLISL